MRKWPIIFYDRGKNSLQERVKLLEHHRARTSRTGSVGKERQNEQGRRLAAEAHERGSPHPRPTLSPQDPALDPEQKG